MIYPFLREEEIYKLLSSSAFGIKDIILDGLCINSEDSKNLKMFYQVTFRSILVKDGKAEIYTTSIPSEYAVDVANFILQADSAMKKRLTEEIEKRCSDCGLEFWHKETCEFYAKTELVTTLPNKSKGETK
jgi:hypothetical protein